MKEKICKTCNWYAEYVGVCCNGESERCAGFRDADDSCKNWTEKGKHEVREKEEDATK